MRRGATARDVLDTFIAQRGQIDAAQQMFSGAQQDRRDDQVQLVDEASAEILPDMSSSAIGA